MKLTITKSDASSQGNAITNHDAQTQKPKTFTVKISLIWELCFGSSFNCTIVEMVFCWTDLYSERALRCFRDYVEHFWRFQFQFEQLTKVRKVVQQGELLWFAEIWTCFSYTKNNEVFVMPGIKCVRRTESLLLDNVMKPWFVLQMFSSYYLKVIRCILVFSERFVEKAIAIDWIAFETFEVPSSSKERLLCA